MRLKNYLHLPRQAEPFSLTQPFLLVAAALVLQGCAAKQVHVRPWTAAIAVRPNLPSTTSENPQASLAVDAPELSVELPSLLSPLGSNKQPTRPRVPVQLAPETAEAHKAAAPSLEPELSQQELAAAQQQLNQSTAIAQRNLNAAKGRSLNPTQSDLTSKVAAFLQESKEAAHAGDWTRARNLAKKAQVLSEELAASL